MSFNRAQFLIEVLGADAARALAKAAGRSEYLSQMIVPRTILAMLEAVPTFEGTVPGLDGYELTYAKSEKGFTGNIGLYKFEDASIFHVAGALSTAMELDTLMFSSGKNTELQRLGKSIDLMAKAHLGAVMLKPIAGAMNAIDSKVTPQGRVNSGRAKLAGHYQRLSEHLAGSQAVDLKPHPDGKEGKWLAYPAGTEKPPVEYAPREGGPKGAMPFLASVASHVRGGGKAHLRGSKVEEKDGLNRIYHTDNLDNPALNEHLLEQFKASGNKGVRAYVGKYHTFVPKDNVQHESEVEVGLLPKSLMHEQQLTKKAMGEGKGASAGPVAPAAPQAPTATAPPASTQQKLPKNPGSAQLPKPPKPVTSSTVKLTRSEQERACQMCGLRQYNADHKFVGCLCFRALAKSVDVIDHPEYSELHLGEDWDRDTIVTFLESVGRK